MPDGKRPNQQAIDERFRRAIPEAVLKGRAEKAVDSVCLQIAHLVPEMHQARGCLPGMHDFLWRRLKAEDQRRQAEAQRLAAHPVQDALMPQVEAIENTDRGDTPGQHCVNTRSRAAKHLHERRVRRKRPDYKVGAPLCMRMSAIRNPAANKAAK